MLPVPAAEGDAEAGVAGLALPGGRRMAPAPFAFVPLVPALPVPVVPLMPPPVMSVAPALFPFMPFIKGLAACFPMSTAA